ncbi:cytochrome P450 4V2-like [Sitodiplosis mosellana]|uniref:cytochrome P450 4V2-like n=1 Tax=Sitodiplosis mosellana TaxID=263140 RepID=UPI002443EC90|nr:cytochrome P450 4V2-like [Sitodiplosis mosellana]
MWKAQRKQLSTSFNNQICRSFLPIFNQKANVFVWNVRRVVGKGHFDMLEYTSAWALDVVCHTAIGSEMNIQSGENMHYTKELTDWLTAVTYRIANVFLHPDTIYQQTRWYRQEQSLTYHIFLCHSIYLADKSNSGQECAAIAISEALQENIISQKMDEFMQSNNEDLSFIEEDDDDSTSQLHYRSRHSRSSVFDNLCWSRFICAHSGHDHSNARAAYEN